MSLGLLLCLLTVFSSPVIFADAYFVPSRNSMVWSAHARSRSRGASRMTMFLEGSGSSKRKQEQVQKELTKADTTTLGNMQVPVCGVGTISWSSESLTDLENLELQSLVNTACSSNGAFFDTAERYGSNFKTALGLGWGETEMLTRKLLSRTVNGEAKNAIVATKFTPTPWRTTVQSVVEACEDSCNRLGVEQLDLYQIHMPDIVQPFRFLGMGEPKDEIYWQGLVECYNRGLVKNVGVCNYGPTLLLRAQEALARKNVPLASNQIGYSLVGRHNGAQKTVDVCNDVGIKVLAFFPFAMGLLTGKYTSDSIDVMAEGTITSLVSNKKTQLEKYDLGRYVNGDSKSIPSGGIRPLLQVMEKVAQKRGKTIAQVALNYIICKGAIPIPGARTEAQVRDNIGSMGWRLGEDEIALLETAADDLGFDFEGAGFKRTSEKFVGYGVERWALD